MSSIVHLCVVLLLRTLKLKLLQAWGWEFEDALEANAGFTSDC
jgi:hypothetical protein